MASGIFWNYVSRHHRLFASASDPRILVIASQAWFTISIGWVISILLGFANVYFAYAAWVLSPNLVAVWGNHRRRLLVRSR
jgi:hypothetical protein